MTFRQSTLYVFCTIAAVCGVPAVGLSQTSTFKVPTHPTSAEVAELSNEGLKFEPMTSERVNVQTYPRLSEQSLPTVVPTQIDPVSTQIDQVETPQSSSSQELLGRQQTFFSRLPTLVRTSATQNAVYTQSTYEFTLTVPADAGAPLKAVTIVQDKNLETLSFNANKSKAFAGDRYAAGPEISLANVGGQETPGVATIVFDQPVQPGNTVTIAVDVAANPSFGGIYEFGVTAYPADESSQGQFLGYGRIAFYQG